MQYGNHVQNNHNHQQQPSNEETPAAAVPTRPGSGSAVWQERIVHRRHLYFPRAAADAAMPDKTRQYVGMKLRELRVKRGVQQSIVAMALGVPENVVSRAENGKTRARLPYARIAAYYGQQLDALLPPDYYRRVGGVTTAPAATTGARSVVLGGWDLSPLEQALVETFRGLGVVDQRALLQMALEMARDGDTPRQQLRRATLPTSDDWSDDEEGEGEGETSGHHA